MTHLLFRSSARHLVRHPLLTALSVLGIASVLFFFVAYWIFDRLRDSFAEEV